MNPTTKLLDTIICKENAQKWWEAQDQFVFVADLISGAGIAYEPHSDHIDGMVNYVEARLDTLYLDSMLDDTDED